jgi:uncharacterized membrane-anchored protein
MSIAFDTVFSFFVLLIVGLVVVAVRWGLRRDKAERDARTAAEDDRAGEPEQLRPS